MVHLDLKDRRILFALDRNSRQSYAQISKKVHLSKEVVQYRIKKLIEEGIIKNFITIIDSTKLGYLLFRCFIKCQNLNKEKEKEILEYLKPQVGWIVNVRGEWDFNIAVWKENIYDFVNFWEAFYMRFSDSIIDYTTHLIPTMWIYQRKWLLENEKGVVDLWGGEPTQIHIDSIDKRILQRLVNDARKPSLDIAKELKISEGTVRVRLKKLKAKKIILRYGIFLDTAKLGMSYFKLHFHVKNINQRKLSSIRAFAHAHPAILYGNSAIGGHFLEFDVNVSSQKELYTLIEVFRETFPDVIKDYEFFEYTQEHQFKYLP